MPPPRSSAYPPRRLDPLTFALLSVVVGAAAGFGAVILRFLIALFHNLLLLRRFSFEYNANVHTPPSPWGAGVILVPILTAIVVVYLIKNYAPEARGHGAPEVMDAIHYQKGIIRPVVGVIKSLASALSIGSGGSVGREGPMIQIGASFGSTLAQVLRLAVWERMTLVACGAGGGIAAAFNTPVGGVLFAVELIMPEISARTLVPVAIATVTASYIARFFFGVHPAFIIPSLEEHYFQLENPLLLFAYVALGFIAGLISTAFIKTLSAAEDFFQKRVVNEYRQHLLGMSAVGLLMYGVMVTFGHYYVEGVGYAGIQDVLSGWQGPVSLLVFLAAAKLAATCLTLGSGASGGIFSPSLFMGATLGSTYGFLLAHLFPTAEINPAAFAVAGMAGVVGGATGAALTAIVMIFEMTLDYNVIMPMTLTVAISYEIRKLLCAESIYTFKLVERGHRMPEAIETNAHFFRRTRDLMDAHVRVVPASATEAELERQAQEQPDVHFFLLEGPGGITGVRPKGQDSVTDCRKCCILGGDLTLLDALERMHRSEAPLALVSSNGSLAPPHVLGIITRDRLADALAESIERYND
jgi:CIC family chloride channel protein